MNRRLGRGDPEVERILTELKALNAIVQAIDKPEELQDALRLVRQVWAGLPEPATTEQFIIAVAVAKLLGEQPVRCASIPRPPIRRLEAGERWTVHAFEIIGLAWISWACARPTIAAEFLRRLWAEPYEPSLNSEEAEHQKALVFWGHAVEALLTDDLLEARRSFNRAYEVGTGIGTDSHTSILWTLAASLAHMDTLPLSTDSSSTIPISQQALN